MKALRFDEIENLLRYIIEQFGVSSTTSHLAAEVSHEARVLKNEGKLNGTNLFLLVNCLFYASMGGDGISLRRRFHECAGEMDYVIRQ